MSLSKPKGWPWKPCKMQDVLSNENEDIDRLRNLSLRLDDSIDINGLLMSHDSYLLEGESNVEANDVHAILQDVGRLLDHSTNFRRQKPPLRIPVFSKMRLTHTPLKGKRNAKRRGRGLVVSGPSTLSDDESFRDSEYVSEPVLIFGQAKKDTTILEDLESQPDEEVEVVVGSDLMVRSGSQPYDESERSALGDAHSKSQRTEVEKSRGDDKSLEGEDIIDYEKIILDVVNTLEVESSPICKPNRWLSYQAAELPDNARCNHCRHALKKSGEDCIKEHPFWYSQKSINIFYHQVCYIGRIDMEIKFEKVRAEFMMICGTIRSAKKKLKSQAKMGAHGKIQEESSKVEQPHVLGQSKQQNDASWLSPPSFGLGQTKKGNGSNSTSNNNDRKKAIDATKVGRKQSKNTKNETKTGTKIEVIEVSRDIKKMSQGVASVSSQRSVKSSQSAPKVLRRGLFSFGRARKPFSTTSPKAILRRSPSSQPKSVPKTSTTKAASRGSSTRPKQIQDTATPTNKDFSRRPPSPKITETTRRPFTKANSRRSPSPTARWINNPRTNVPARRSLSPHPRMDKRTVTNAALVRSPSPQPRLIKTVMESESRRSPSPISRNLNGTANQDAGRRSPSPKPSRNKEKLYSDQRSDDDQDREYSVRISSPDRMIRYDDSGHAITESLDGYKRRQLSIQQQAKKKDEYSSSDDESDYDDGSSSSSYDDSQSGTDDGSYTSGDSGSSYSSGSNSLSNGESLDGSRHGGQGGSARRQSITPKMFENQKQGSGHSTSPSPLDHRSTISERGHRSLFQDERLKRSDRGSVSERGARSVVRNDGDFPGNITRNRTASNVSCKPTSGSHLVSTDRKVRIDPSRSVVKPMKGVPSNKTTRPKKSAPKKAKILFFGFRGSYQ